MIKKRRLPRIFFGWWTVLTGGFLVFWGLGFTMTGMTALFKPIASELGFSRAATSVATSIGRLEGAFEAPLAGWLNDRFGPRWVILAGIFVIGLGLILMRFVDSLWSFYLVWGVIIGTGGNIGLGASVDKAITNWFVKKRGVAMGIKWVFSGLGVVAVLPLIAWLIIIRGWRETCVIGGLVMWLVGLPLVWFLIKRERPEYYGLLPDGATTEVGLEEDASRMIDRGVEYAAEVKEVEFTLRQAMGTPVYWLLIASQAVETLAYSTIIIHRMPFLTDMGIDPLRAAAIIAMTNATSLPFRFASGFIADRIRTDYLRFLLGGAYLLKAVGITAFLLNQSIAMVYVWFILYHIGAGSTFPLHALVRGRYFGRKAYGSIQGSETMVMTPVGVIAPVYAGWIYDTTGSYIPAFTLIAALVGFTGILAAFIRPPKPPARITDIHKIV